MRGSPLVVINAQRSGQKYVAQQMTWTFSTFLAALAVLATCLVGFPMMVFIEGRGSHRFAVRTGFVLYAGGMFVFLSGSLDHVWPVGLAMAVLGIVAYQPSVFWWRSDDTPSLWLRPAQWAWAARTSFIIAIAIGIVRVVGASR